MKTTCNNFDTYKMTFIQLNVILFFLLIFFSTYSSAENKDIEILYFGTKEDTAFIGVGQGLEDGSNIHPGVSFRIMIEAENYRPYNDPKPKAIFVAAGSESIRLISSLNPDIPIFNLIDDTVMIRELCLKNVFHIIPDNAMRFDAEQQWQAKYQEATVEVVAWHPDFNIGNASKLNQKFLEKRNVTLTEQGWSGWAAAKIFVESMVAVSKKKEMDLITYLKRNVHFDVNKGVPVSFRADGQLRQTLLIIEDSFLKSEVPAKDLLDKEDLDKLGELRCS